MFERLDFFCFIGSQKRLYKVLLIILKAIIPIGAIWITGLSFLGY
jgi:hypothetical protein